MDIVITYVDGLDPVWQKDYEKFSNVPIMQKRFRNWGLLPYLMRGIEENMSFIRKVHLVVSHQSQVPEWVNREEVNVVLHKDIIPAEYLPTFNSNTIETHLHRIEGLDEEYLYFNDDIFPVAKCSPEDFFRQGKGVIGISRHLFATGMFKKICRNSDALARRALGIKKSCFFLRPQHICAPMLRSECERLYMTIREDILATLSRTRTEKNVTQYMFTNYLYLQGKIINERISRRHFSVAVASPKSMCRAIEQPSRKLICINDVKISEERYATMHRMLHETFQKRFPRKSKYEI